MAQGQGRSSGQGVKLLYIRDYLYKHATKEHPKNANAICDYLLTKEIEASPKTIYNDITRLKYDFGVPVEYNPKKWGYYITTPEFEPYELRLMIDSIQASKFITQYALIKTHHISPGQITRLKRNESVSTHTDVGDIMQYIPEEK